MKRVLILHSDLAKHIDDCLVAACSGQINEVRAVNILGMGSAERAALQEFTAKSASCRGFLHGSGVDIRTFLKRTSRAATFLPAALCRSQSASGVRLASVSQKILEGIAISFEGEMKACDRTRRWVIRPFSCFDQGIEIICQMV